MSVRAFELRQLELSFSLLFLFLFVARLAKSQVELFIYLQLFFWEFYFSSQPAWASCVKELLPARLTEIVKCF